MPASVDMCEKELSPGLAPRTKERRGVWEAELPRVTQTGKCGGIFGRAGRLSRAPWAVLGPGEAALCGTRGPVVLPGALQGQPRGGAASPQKHARSTVNASLAPAGCLIRVGFFFPQ